MSELNFIRAFDGDTVNIIPADTKTAEVLLSIPPHQVFQMMLEDRQRTPKQNAALHVYLRLLAHHLNEAGFDMQQFPFKDGFKLPWSEHTTKDFLWRPIQKAMIGDESTRHLTTSQVDEIYQVLSQKIAETTGISLPFPQRGLE